MFGAKLWKKVSIIFLRSHFQIHEILIIVGNIMTQKPIPSGQIVPYFDFCISEDRHVGSGRHRRSPKIRKYCQKLDDCEPCAWDLLDNFGHSAQSYGRVDYLQYILLLEISFVLILVQGPKPFSCSFEREIYPAAKTKCIFFSAYQEEHLFLFINIKISKFLLPCAFGEDVDKLATCHQLKLW